MSAVVLLIPFLLIRFALMAALNSRAIRRAAHFAPMRGREKIAYYIYQISSTGIFLYLIFLRVSIDFSWKFYLGIVAYLLGLCLCAASVISFSVPDQNGMNGTGIYQYSRNPMYISYFWCFLGMALLAQSWILLILVLAFQISAHWIIRAEERWCLEQFGESYRQYMREVRRYI